MPETIGGFIGGYLEAGDILQNQAANALKLQEMGVEVQNAQLDLRQHKLMIQAAQRLVNRPAPGTPTGIASGGTFDESVNVMKEWGDALFQVGLPEQGMKAYKEAVTVEKDAAEVADKTLDREIKANQMLANAMQGVHDEASWRGAWQTMLAAHPEFAQSPQYAELMKHINGPYDPAFKDHLIDAATTNLQKATAKQKEAQAKLEEAQAGEADYRWHKYLPEKTREAGARADAIHKVTGGDGGALKKEEIDSAYDMLAKDYPPGDLPEGKSKLRNLARMAAENARILRMTDGLGETESNERAIELMKRSDPAIFADLRRAKPGLGGFEKPVTIAPGTDAKAFMSDPTKAGKWYKSPDGTVKFWDGEKWWSKEDYDARKSRRSAEGGEDDDAGDED